MQQKAVLISYDNHQIGALKLTIQDLDLSSYDLNNLIADNKDLVIERIDQFVKDFYSHCVDDIMKFHSYEIEQSEEEWLDNYLFYEFDDERKLIKVDFIFEETFETLFFKIIDDV